MLDPFHLVVGHVGRLELLVPHGVKLVQLRIGDRPEAEIRRQVARARDICAVHRAQLVVADHWQIALDLGCSFVHLGEGAMAGADFAAMRRAGMRVGLSAHDAAGRERALARAPAYVALAAERGGKPPGRDRVRRWKAALGDVPLVCAGGLRPAHLAGLFAAGADSAAVMTDIRRAENPEARCAEWIAATQARRASTCPSLAM